MTAGISKICVLYVLYKVSKTIFHLSMLYSLGKKNMNYPDFLCLYICCLNMLKNQTNKTLGLHLWTLLLSHLSHNFL